MANAVCAIWTVNVYLSLSAGIIRFVSSGDREDSMRFADDWQTVIGTALALLGGKSASVSQSSAPEMSADDNAAYSVSTGWTVRFRTFTQINARDAARGAPRAHEEARVLAYFFVVAAGVVDVATTCHLPPLSRDKTCRL